MKTIQEAQQEVSRARKAEAQALHQLTAAQMALLDQQALNVELEQILQSIHSMEVTFRIPLRADDPPSKVFSVTLKQTHVPRTGDWVSVDADCGDAGGFNVEGEVARVSWHVTEAKTSVTVMIK